MGALAIQVFLDTYAKVGIRADLAREALAHYAPEAFSARLADPHTTFVVAEKDDGLLAFGEVTRHRPCPVATLDGTVELVRLYVQPASQGLGLGRALLQRAETLAKETGARTLWLTAWVGNAPALAFYRAQGYQRVGTTDYVVENRSYENHVLAKTVLGRVLSSGV